VVVSRNVDVGQTVAASLQAPTLFTIANDLTKMQVLASVDEADVGQIKQGIKANFTVDAFPGENFSGEVSQVRLNAQALQNVVTYTAVVEVSNPELKLRPGMTTNITFPVQQRENVLTVPNAALRFKPELSESEQEDLRQQMEARREQRSEQRARQGDAQREQRRNRSENQTGERSQRQTVWVLTADKKIEPRFVRAGLTNGRVTEIAGGTLQEGETVVIGKTEANATASQPASSPFAPQGGRGMGRRGR
jgi:HlyD family secretion protein